MLKTVSLFSGAGGMDLGFERAGYTIVFANELNPDSARTWLANRPESSGVMRVGDLTSYLGDLSGLSGVDLVIGGPPCQGFSVAGKMDKNDPRSKLVFTYLDVVERVRPKVFLMENVPALATSDRWEDVRLEIAKRSSDLGYATAFRVYDACNYGVPEHRRRMLLVGVQREFGDPALFHIKMAESTKEPRSLRDVLQSVGEYGSKDNPATCTAKVTVAKRPVMRGHAYSGMLVNGAGRPLDLSRPSPTLTASMGGNNTPLIDENNLWDASKRHWFETLYDVLSTEGKYEAEVPENVRRLTLSEAAAIQTFPREYKFSGSTCSRYRQIGNAVPCHLSQAAAKALCDAYFSSCDCVGDVSNSGNMDT